MMGRGAAGVAVAFILAYTAWTGCGGDTVEDERPLEPATGSIEGFTAPIDISVGEVIAYAGDREIRRAEFRDGQFRLDGLPAGVYRLVVLVFAYQPNDAAQGIVLEAGETIDLGRFILIGDGDLMADIPRIRGAVTDSVGGEPLANVSVRATCSAGVCSVQTTATDADGAFEVLAPTEQEVTVSFAVAGHVPRFLTVPPISAGEAVTLNAELAPDRR